MSMIALRATISYSDLMKMRRKLKPSVDQQRKIVDRVIRRMWERANG